MSVETPEHLERRRVLLRLEQQVEALEAHELNASQAENLEIEIHQVTLDRTSNCKPFFFRPHSSLPEPEDNRVNHIHSVLDDEDPCFTDPVDRAYQIENNWSSYTFQSPFETVSMPWSRKSVGDYTPYKSVYGYEQPEFGTFRMTDIPGGSFPHTKAVIYNNLEGKNQHILRGELLIILRLMLGQLRKRRFHHMIAPVLVISFMGKCGRAIEAYFDGRKLILGCSGLYHFRDQTSKALRDFAEWYLSDPIGNTA
ncbi:hypothetical protein P170DRAFT_513009 [Aspergillus steynii IBT 23096]|uniref:Uncharacterized protein n=1 Tax=Aspergillus steynii IBT 23096 TaxID=1392250 RepID=A0A2I2FW92_9EURO|nr:uncharacterized protein P170DRAFT_513009 [Aspergillus steynii IBT 23096]PLB44885.1 hypothetical protein P170DRAFT_513009 [Aspergillus steynii IBT 23096]